MSVALQQSGNERLEAMNRMLLEFFCDVTVEPEFFLALIRITRCTMGWKFVGMIGARFGLKPIYNPLSTT